MYFNTRNLFIWMIIVENPKHNKFVENHKKIKQSFTPQVRNWKGCAAKLTKWVQSPGKPDPAPLGNPQKKLNEPNKELNPITNLNKHP